MQELPHGFPFTQCGFLVSAEAPLRQELINWLRASAVRAACRRIAVFHSLLSGVCIASTAIMATAIRYLSIDLASRSPSEEGFSSPFLSHSLLI
jgi:hypothetical protein